jgi:hypothetical protein
MPQTFARTQVGLREDLADKIYLIDAKDTPMLSTVPKGQALVNPLFDWQVDAYNTPDTSGIVDGTDVSSTINSASNRLRIQGRCQKIRRAPKVTDFTEITDVAGIGVGKEFARAIAQETVVAKRSVECVLGSDTDSQADNGTAANLTRGLGKWAQATNYSDLPLGNTAFLTPAASIDTTAMASFTLATLNGVMESQYLQTGKVQSYMLVVGSTLKKTITNAVGYQPTVANQTAILRSNRGDEGSWSNNIQSFTGDFGTYDLVVSNWLGYSAGTSNVYRGYAFDPMNLELRMNKPWNFRELEDQGGGRRGIIECIFGFMVKNPLGLAKFAASS